MRKKLPNQLGSFYAKRIMADNITIIAQKVIEY